MTTLDEQILGIDRNVKEWQESFLERFKLLEQDLQSVKDSIAKLKEERRSLEQMRDELQEKKASLTAAVGKAEEDLKSLQAEEETLVSQISALRSENAQLESDVTEIERQIAELTEKISDLEQRKQQLENQKGEMSKNIKSVEAMLPQATQEVDLKIMKTKKELERREFMYKAMETLIKKGYASSLTEVRVLQHLKYNKPMKVRELAMVAGFQQAVIDEVLEKLEASGIIEKVDEETVVLKYPIPFLGVQ